MSRSKLLPLFLFAVVFAFVAAAQPAAAAEPSSPACGFDVSALVAQAPVETLASPALLPNPGLAPAVPEPSFLTIYHGFCKCSCSHIRNCNTSADCGGGACIGGITCC
jgi:hypothetical protein